MPTIDERNHRVLGEVYELLANLGRKVREQNESASMPADEAQFRSDSNGRVKAIRSTARKKPTLPTQRQLVSSSPYKASNS